MISIRIDDFPNTKGEPLHTLDNFKRFEDVLFQTTGVNYLLGVIPYRTNEDDLEFLTSSPCVVGMHGIKHDEQALDIYGNEFPRWMTTNDVCKDLSWWKHWLQFKIDKPIDIYMPPRNIIDQKTIDALPKVGFKAFTGGPETDTKTIEQKNLQFIMSSPPNEYGRSDEMFQRGSHTVLSLSSANVVLTLHWTWEMNIGLDHLKKFLSSIDRACFMNFPLP